MTRQFMAEAKPPLQEHWHLLQSNNHPKFFMTVIYLAGAVASEMKNQA
jgi:hypothetical protein